MSENEEKKWEPVSGDGTDCMKVDGGYIYRCQKGNGGLAMVFVPEIDLTRYESHLRDAYNRGYETGQEDIKQLLEKAASHA